MQLLSAQADRLNTQISTGKKLAQPSDDAIAYSRLRGLTTATADDAAMAKNLDMAGALLSQADTALSSIQSQLQRASELAIQANNGTLSDANRQAIATELDGIIQTIAGLADAKDQRGQPLMPTRRSITPSSRRSAASRKRGSSGSRGWRTVSR